MALRILCLLLLAAAVVATASIDARFNQALNHTLPDHLKFIGQTVSTRYYISLQKANYQAARRDCLNNNLETASFEIKSNLEDVRNYFNLIDDSAVTFWVGAVAAGEVLACRNNLTNDCFMWEETETPLGLHIVWSRRSNALYNGNSRMYLIRHRRGSPSFDFDDNTNNYRYICEEPVQ